MQVFTRCVKIPGVIFGHPGLVLSPAGTVAVGPPNLAPLAAVGPGR